MALKNKVGLTSSADLAREEERIGNMKGIDRSYYYEGYTAFKTEEL